MSTLLCLSLSLAGPLLRLASFQCGPDTKRKSLNTDLLEWREKASGREARLGRAKCELRAEAVRRGSRRRRRRRRRRGTH